MNIPSSVNNKVINILIVDDDEDDFLIIKEYIKNISGSHSFTIQWCGSYQEAVKTICRGEHDIYFVDFRLGPRTGLDLIKEVIGNKCEQPIILLTGAGNKEIDLLAMQAGAADYLVKSELNTEKLERCIRYAVARHEFLIALKANEQKYRGIFEKTKDFIFIAGETLLFKEVNQVCTSLFGFTREEMLQMHLYDLLADKSDATGINNNLLAAGEIKDRELDLRAKNNQIINCVLSLSSEKDAAGLVYIQGIIHDISGLKNAEKAALQTAKLKAAERLVRTLAHEVRNPLNNIILSVEQLLPRRSEQEKVFTDIIQRNSDRINKLITELLNSSRPAVISLEKASLQSILDKSISAAMDRIILKQIDLRQEYCPDNAWIMADPDKLSIAFLNIIINGVEASPPNEARMEVKLIEERDNYIVSITDNGHGISEENLSQLFEPYYTSKAGGMGLG
ncbi:MAG: response regulator, partial [Bacteroidota bacterium]|nr:response regulator [Bacteroidota bacterium]